MKSPCILVCSIDMETGFCFGCGRTGREISLWTSYSDRERDFLMAALPARLATIKRKPRRETRRSRMARERAGALPGNKDPQF
ncbi:MAG: DUF1289 domain-containing protein [Nitratireductor sp.]|nr:DUF1289 domain-containing protein [Nitratireductor sp.]